MNSLEYRLATEADLSTLNHLYADMYRRPLMDREKINEIWQKILQVPDYYIYLAYLNNQAIGTFSLIFIPTLIYPGFHKSAMLDVVTIKSEHRGKGWGTKMIQKALKISADAGCYKVNLSSNLKRDRAHKFYQSLGFKQHGLSFSYQLDSKEAIRE